MKYLFFNKKDDDGVTHFNWNRRFKPANFCFQSPPAHFIKRKVRPSKKDVEKIMKTESNDTVDNDADHSVPVILDFSKAKDANKSIDRNGIKPEFNSEDEVTVTLNFKDINVVPPEPKKISKNTFYLSAENLLSRQLSPNQKGKPGNKPQPHKKKENKIEIPLETNNVSDIQWFVKSPSPNSKRKLKMFHW